MLLFPCTQAALPAEDDRLEVDHRWGQVVADKQEQVQSTLLLARYKQVLQVLYCRHAQVYRQAEVDSHILSAGGDNQSRRKCQVHVQR